MQNYEIKVDVYTLCWNEMKVLPFVVDYWKKFARKVYVYDNGSDDGSIEYLKKFDWIEVRKYKTNGFNDVENKKIKNTVWQGSDADFVVVCDLDECLYCDNIIEKLKQLKEEEVTLVKPRWFEAVGTKFPKHKDGVLINELPDVKFCEVNTRMYPKCTLFNPKAIKKMNFTPGAHRCAPTGKIKWYKGSDIFTIHLKNLSLDYLMKRYRTLNKRLSVTNKKYRFGIQYAFEDNKIIDGYNKFKNKALPFEEAKKKKVTPKTQAKPRVQPKPTRKIMVRDFIY